MTRLVPQRDLESFCRDLLEQVGMPKKHATVVTDSLVAADLRGVGSHGERRTKGIPLDDSVIGELVALAGDLGVHDVPATMR